MNPAPVPTGLIQVSGLCKRFGASTVVNRLALDVRAGEIFGLVGPDGAGKTTVVRMLAGVLRPDGGSIVIDGVDVGADPERAKRHLSYMPQRFGLYEDLTVDENIRFYADLFEVERRTWRARADQMLAACGLTEFRGRLVGKLSGGMKQKVGLTCSLVHTPRILLLDEPTTGVDPVSRREFWQLLYGLRAEGVAILIATAYLDEAERCDRLALMNEGAVLMSDTPAALKARMPGLIVEVLSPQPRAVRDTLAGLPGVLGVLVVGIGAHIHLDQHGRVPQLGQRLRDAGVPVERIREVPPTVEDLFVAALAASSERTAA
ncbi:ABC transporter ATP-binding protein [Duganella vulcania]|uniref:ATP-binding cassette domain-containing protein n=1 Tax=Duganella vulcania TaxID=2692166 RepID=A0A845GUN2_9BURK|nr:ABC transporter ATP-binding protein [Duganella vulcania]MYM97771.1 ATP-binding cassette domain-containing protein [Duganella vulcania]